MAKAVIKSDSDIKDFLNNIKEHFKTGKWPLSYVIYKDLFKLGKNEIVFQHILRINGYHIRMDGYQLTFSPKRKRK